MHSLDFTYGIENEQFLAYKIADKAEVCVLSKSLNVARTNSGKPAFLIESVRGITPFSKPDPYALLQMQFLPSAPNAEIKAAVQTKWPEATISTVDIASGYILLQFHIATATDDITLTPIALEQMPLSRLQIVQRLSMNYFQLFQSALAGDVLLLSATGWYRAKGFPPRVDVTVSFNPVLLFNAIKEKVLKTNSSFVKQTLTLLLRDKLSTLPITIESNGEPDYAILSETLSLRLIAHFCAPLQPGEKTNDVSFIFNEETGVVGLFTWDLREKQIVEQYVSFGLDGLEELHKLIKDGKFDEYTHTRIVEPLPIGFQQVEVYHPFMMMPLGIRQLGIKISAAPVVPHRNQAIQETIIFDATSIKKICTLRFSPKETFRYSVQPFVIAEDMGNTKEINGEVFTSTDNILRITREHYPLKIIGFSCDQFLLSEAAVQIEVIAPDQQQVLPSFSFSKEKSVVFYAMEEQNAQTYSAQIHAVNLSNDKETAAMAFALTEDHKIVQSDFDDYGLHCTTIKLHEEEEELVAVQLLPAQAQETHENITSIALTISKPKQDWFWYSQSIFNAGFRYKLGVGEDEPWSHVLPWETKELYISNKIIADDI